MDNKVTKERFNNHIEYDWFKYIVFILVAVFLWVFIYSMLDKPKDYQKLDIFITVSFDQEKTQKFEADFIKYLNDLGDDTIKEVNFIFHDYNKNDLTFGQILQTSYTTCDLVIADEEAMRYLVAGDRLISFDRNYNMIGSVFEGFSISQGDIQTIIDPYLKQQDFQSYYVFDQAQKDKYVEEYKDMFETGGDYNEYIDTNILNYTFGIDLKQLGDNLFFEYGYVIDEEGNTTEEQNKYYIGVVLPNLAKNIGGGNKGVFNAQKQSIDNKQAWTAINYLKMINDYII